MEERDLLVSRVPRALELKNKLFGYELSDVLIVFFHLSMMNLCFGGTRFRGPLVWGTTILLGLILHFAKKGKPDGYVQHMGELLTTDSNRFAGRPDTKCQRSNGRMESQSVSIQIRLRRHH